MKKMLLIAVVSFSCALLVTGCSKTVAAPSNVASQTKTTGVTTGSTTTTGTQSASQGGHTCGH